MNRQITLITALCIITVSSVICALFFFSKAQNHTVTPPITEPIDNNGRPVPTAYERNAVKNTITKNAMDVQVCYKDLLSRNPKSSDGTVKIDWQILQDGKVSTVEVVQSQFNDLSLEKCLISKIEKWTFPPPPTERPFYIAHLFRFKKEK